MSQTVAIILRFHAEEADRFEQLFQAEVYPLWEEFKMQGKFLAASLTPVQEGSELKGGFVITSCTSNCLGWRNTRGLTRTHVS